MEAAPSNLPPPTLDEVVRTYWPILAISFGVSLLATPVCRWYARRRKIVDRPDDFLKPHKQPIPYLGGVGIFLGWIAGLVAALLLFDGPLKDNVTPRSGPSMNVSVAMAVMLAGAVVVGIGLFDDLRMLSPKVKLAGVALVTAWLIYMGVGDDTIYIALRAITSAHAEFPHWLIVVYSIPVTLFFTLGACNATNLIDGLDGLCSGVLGLIAAGFLILAVNLHIINSWDPWDPWDVLRVVLCLAMMGAALGFLPYNRNPATIFMGDAGSMLLGLNAAILLLLFAKSNALRWLLGSLMVFGLPLADMTLALVRRWRNGRPVMQGDRSHFYDQLVDRGLPVRRVVGISYALTAFFAVAGCLAIGVRTRYLIPLYGLVILAVIYAVQRFDMVRIERPRDGNNSPEGQ